MKDKLLNSLPTWFSMHDLNAMGLSNDEATAKVAEWTKGELVSPIPDSDFFQIL